MKAGVEMPTGKFYSTYREEDVPPAMSAGSGSWDVLTGLRFSYFKNNVGYLLIIYLSTILKTAIIINSEIRILQLH